MKAIDVIMPAAIAVFGIGVGYLLGYRLSEPKTPKKEYPIEVTTYWSADGYQAYTTMEADSVRGDTVWQDGNFIVAKGIVKIKFK